MSLMADGIVTSSTPRLTCASVRGLARRVRFIAYFFSSACIAVSSPGTMVLDFGFRDNGKA